ncbi:hypothetical protein FA95DRAFT_1480024 [Auriscalpium vulgare]|uniref:Uncharacterized protein n=1 Tax=Auriscalpium vulgare TaxID=40419 RepID=A0ACB8SD21_9AGAM|nr:hypothetical protein FA95DRAFT_1480024 [Auriscalpium vulgare]
MLRRCTRLTARPSHPHRALFPRHPRNESTKQSPTPWRQDITPEPSVLVEENYAKHTLFTFDFFRRLVKFSLIGVMGIAVTGATAFELTHMWVETVELVPERDEECTKWEWDLEAERWTGGTSGGTDPGLGFKGRHAVRSAWMAQNWGVGSSANLVGSSAFGGKAGSPSGGLNVVEARLEFAQDFLTVAFNIAMRTEASGALRPQTLTELLARHGDVMERMGSKDGLYEARSEFQRVWARIAAQGPDAARVALKLGDLNSRLGNAEDALAWWARSLQLVSGDNRESPIPVIPTAPPVTPSAQRTLASALVSLSAFYATSGQLRQAQTVEESALSLLRSIRPPESSVTSSPPHALHALYLLHRSALISVHLAEVLYALRTPPDTSISWLSQAAESSERVAFALTGLPLTHPDAPGSKIPHPPASESPLLRAFRDSPSMKKPARSLLRDARRSAAEAWNLLGVLNEGHPDAGSLEKSLECYERALGWAGVALDRAGGIGKAGEGVLDAEWQVLWGNYVRVREAVRNNTGKQSGLPA